ncbi:hypothetical protein RHMOL_Rhmol04G0207600 [Rhododendron molle]|uniref:Uncharacterized protein n=1 Tax=Rhododendron molle TaxID=49168 RepID=A0ACC0P543_RHOML|nr:hypothetical protein RHMOL_Rhmol04G0207600 [Rhododendron molle]
MVLCKRESTKLCKRGSPFCIQIIRTTTVPDHQNCYWPSKRESTKQFHNSKIKFRMVYGVSSQEEMLATL